MIGIARYQIIVCPRLVPSDKN